MWRGTWKHSQYFFLQPLFLQLQPLRCSAVGLILASNAVGLRATIASRVFVTKSLRRYDVSLERGTSLQRKATS